VVSRARIVTFSLTEQQFKALIGAWSLHSTDQEGRPLERYEIAEAQALSNVMGKIKKAWYNGIPARKGVE
jgi:hypothetical protein